MAICPIICLFCDLARALVHDVACEFACSKDAQKQLLLRISCAHAIHWSRACHVIFKRAHRVENSTKHRADDLCVNLVCEYFCWMLGDSQFFFGRSLPFLTLSIILKNNKKKICVWEVLILLIYY